MIPLRIDLVSQDRILDLHLGRYALVGPKHAEDAAQEEVEERADHGAALSEIGPPWLLLGHDRVSGPPRGLEFLSQTAHRDRAGQVRVPGT